MIIERHGERIDLRLEVAPGPMGSKYRHDQMTAYLALSLEQSYIDIRDADDERGNDNGCASLRFGRRVYSWDDRGVHDVTRFATVTEAEAEMLELWPITWEEAIDALGQLPALTGFGPSLDSYEDLLSLAFNACEALSVVADDWGYYALATVITSECQFRGSWSESWLDDDDGLPHTAEEAARLAEEDPDGKLWDLWSIGSHFYQPDAEEEAIELLRAIETALAAGKREGLGER
jgi:hypothetical protein